MAAASKLQPRWARMAVLIAFVSTAALAEVAVALTESGGVRLMPDAFSIAVEGGCGSLVG